MWALPQAVPFSECPGAAESTIGLDDLKACDKVEEGELCEADGECGTKDSDDNCVYPSQGQPRHGHLPPHTLQTLPALTAAAAAAAIATAAAAAAAAAVSPGLALAGGGESGGGGGGGVVVLVLLLLLGRPAWPSTCRGSTLASAPSSRPAAHSERRRETIS